MTRSVVMVVLVIVLLAAPRAAPANGEPLPSAAPPPPTHFERFVLSGCSPCVQESHLVKTVAISPVKLPPNPRFTTSTSSRPGEIAFEVVRAWELGRAARQLLAVRVTLSVVVGLAGQLFPLGIGVLDADDAGALAAALSEIAKAAAAAPQDAGAKSIDIDFHVGSVRVGVMRNQGDAVDYVQAGDIPTLALRPVWEVPSTIFLPVSELPALAAAMTEVVAKVRTLRGS
jgi:hypothetical protein